MSKDQYIQANWEEGKGEELVSRDPATGKVLWEGKSASSGQISGSVKAAKGAFFDWANTSFQKRVAVILQFAEILKSSKEDLSLAISQQTGKPLWESRTEVGAMLAKIPLSIQAYKERTPEKEEKADETTAAIRHKPHGVIAVLGPFNFPGHLPNGHIIPALLAGNAVVFKPSELTPYVGEKMMKCWEKTDLPPGALNMIQGGASVGKELAEHPDIDGLFFTGSYTTGKNLSELYGTHPEKILALEMGGNNPLLIGEISDCAAAAYITVQSAFLTAGQRCTAARRLILVTSDKSEEFLERLLKMTKSIRVGPYDSPTEPFMGPVISERVAKQLLKKQEELKSQGGKVLLEMKQLKSTTGLISPGIIDVTSIKEREDEEIFGPLLQLIIVPDLKTAIQEANNTKYGLSAAILSDNKEEYETFRQRIRAGIVNWNTQTTGAKSSAPFGGIGHSGNHRPSAFYAADYCAYPTSSVEMEALKMPETKTPGIPL